MTKISDWTDDIGGNVCGGNNSAHADQHNAYIDNNYDGNSNNKVFFANDGGLYSNDNIWTATPNTGWDSHNFGQVSTQFYGGDISLDGTVTIGGSHDNGYTYDPNNSNGAMQWKVYGTGDGGYCKVNKSNGYLFSTTQRGALYRSMNNGTTFCNIVKFNGDSQSACGSSTCSDFNSYQDSPVFIAPLEMHETNNSYLYIGSDRLRVSATHGFNWQQKSPIFSAKISSIETSPISVDKIFVGLTNGKIFKTVVATSNASDWDELTDLDSENEVTDIEVHSGFPTSIAISKGGYHQDHIFVSIDDGTTWLERNLGFDMHVEALTWHPEIPSWLYAATDVGIFTSEDYGLTWNVTPLYDNNDGPIHSRITELFWQGDGSTAYPYYLCATTFGRGMWRSEAPIREKYYVDKLCSPCGTGTFSRPYQNFNDAYSAAGSGSTIIFKTGGGYDAIPPSALLDTRIKIKLHSGSSSSAVLK